jgi:hypothetical protein
VNITDLLSLLNNYGDTGADWAEGDFNYDGTVNITDLLMLLNNYNQSATQVAASRADFTAALAVPEPASIGVLLACGLGLLSRRRARIHANATPTRQDAQ